MSRTCRHTSESAQPKGAVSDAARRWRLAATCRARRAAAAASDDPPGRELTASGPDAHTGRQRRR
jgi:hypothetical protein